MIDRPDRTQTDNDPDIENSEQDDEPEQTHTVAEDALRGEARAPSPLDSVKVHGGIDENDAAPDLIDQMRDMEQSGRIDMGAYAGEPNFDDEEDKYGPENKEDDVPDDRDEQSNEDDDLDGIDDLDDVDDDLDDADDDTEE